jgi:protocatechuate 3,4-dioxygenase, beta subunit
MSHDPMSLSRRQLLRATLAVSGLSLCGPVISVSAQTQLRITPQQVLGPFYPVLRSGNPGVDLTSIQGRTGRAQGQTIHLMGRVLNLRGEPVRGAKVELWQANTHGRYIHPKDTNPAPLDPNFEGYGVQLTDAEGRYRFKTIKPGAYPVGVRNWIRPPHIHFDVTGRIDRIVTQMYFDGELLNEKDEFLQQVGCKECLTVKLAPPSKEVEPDSLMAVWDIVLARG